MKSSLLLSAALAAACACAAPLAVAGAKSQPNIVLVFIDDTPSGAAKPTVSINLAASALIRI
ncbi:MAG: hypothetical protein Q7S40_26975 [Opitutaceae bacterium]|nr:hypothetical protein [Opitutaceae bacterium]